MTIAISYFHKLDLNQSNFFNEHFILYSVLFVFDIFTKNDNNILFIPFSKLSVGINNSNWLIIKKKIVVVSDIDNSG